MGVRRGKSPITRRHFDW